MSKISVVLAVSALAAAFSIGISAPASADSWGCSYEKCLQVCGASGGKYCSNYCSKELADKQRSKVCK